MNEPSLFRFLFSNHEERAQAHGVMALQIQSPSSNATVGTSFQVFGTEGGRSEPSPVTGKMQQGTTVVSTGSTTQQPTSTESGFAISFSNVPAGTGYTLVVTNTAGDMAQSGNITVSATPPGM